MRLITDSFREYLQPTQADFYTCKRTISDKVVYFDLWDTAGQERFKSLLPMYTRDATVAIIVFDVHDPLSLEAAVAQVKENDKLPILALVANKVDMLTDAEQDPLVLEARKQADALNVNFFVTSAKTGLGVAKMFDSLAMAAAKLLAKPGDPILDPSDSPSKGINLVATPAPSFSCWGRISSWWSSSSAAPSSSSPSPPPP
jgi:Ras-related protein Rab-5C